jgi:hypothetical protein
MPAQLEKTDAGSSGPAAAPHRPVTPSPSAVEPLGPDRGLGLLYWFVIATAIMVGGFIAAGAVGKMWILVPGMAAHLSMTFLVLSAIVRLMARGNDE